MIFPEDCSCFCFCFFHLPLSFLPLFALLPSLFSLSGGRETEEKVPFFKQIGEGKQIWGLSLSYPPSRLPGVCFFLQRRRRRRRIRTRTNRKKRRRKRRKRHLYPFWGEEKGVPGEKNKSKRRVICGICFL